MAVAVAGKALEKWHVERSASRQSAFFSRVKRRAELPASRLPSSTEPSMQMSGVIVFRHFALVTFICASK